MLGGIGMQELMVILIIILLLFGAKKIPEMAKGLGKGINEFKKAAKDVKDEVEKETGEVKDDKEDKELKG